jgi:hypothetical protein
MVLLPVALFGRRVLGRFAIPIPEIANSDPFWLKEDPHRTVHTRQTLFGLTLPIYEAYNRQSRRSLPNMCSASPNST